MSTPSEKLFNGAGGGRGMITIFGGIAMIVLTIVALAHINPGLLGAIALIVAGIVLLFKGAALNGQCAKLLGSEGTDAGGGGSAALSAGIAAIVLGILAAIGLASDTLMAVGIIVAGAAFIFSAGFAGRMAALRIGASDADDNAKHAAEEMLAGGMSAQKLAGVAAVVLGILALVNLAPGVLVLVALLSLGGTELMSASAFGGRVSGLLSR
ncbi:MAG: hypothetical protein ACRESA_08745 [Gammaproteobacteria bacterium]